MDCMEPGSDDLVAERVVDMIRASEKMSDAELERWSRNGLGDVGAAGRGSHKPCGEGIQSEFSTGFLDTGMSKRIIHGCKLLILK
jgi:hypothetical protein